MANLQTNPWSFTSADVVTSTPSASPSGLISSAGGIVALATGSAHGLAAGNFALVTGATLAGYNSSNRGVGVYKVLAVPSTTTATLFSQGLYQSQTVLAASGGGTVVLVQYPYMVRAEDLSWLNAAAANDEVILYDRNGNLVWDSIAPTKGTYSRSKPFWIDGIAFKQISSGTVTITVN